MRLLWASQMHARIVVFDPLLTIQDPSPISHAVDVPGVDRRQVAGDFWRGDLSIGSQSHMEEFRLLDE